MIAFLKSLVAAWRIAFYPCPGCGSRRKKLQCVIVSKKEKPNATVMIERECKRCHCKCYQPTVLPPEKWIAAELLEQTGSPRTS
jgi:hypothetical protein